MWQRLKAWLTEPPASSPGTQVVVYRKKGYYFIEIHVGAFKSKGVAKAIAKRLKKQLDKEW